MVQDDLSSSGTSESSMSVCSGSRDQAWQGRGPRWVGNILIDVKTGSQILTYHYFLPQTVLLHPVKREARGQVGQGAVRAHERCRPPQDRDWRNGAGRLCWIDEASEGPTDHGAEPDRGCAGPVPYQAPPGWQDHLQRPQDINHCRLPTVRSQREICLQFLLCRGPALDHHGPKTQ